MWGRQPALHHYYSYSVEKKINPSAVPGGSVGAQRCGAQTPHPPKIPRSQIHNALRAHAPVNGPRPGMARRCADAKENLLVPPPVKPPNGERSTRDQAGGRPPARTWTGVKFMLFSLEGLKK